MGRGARAPQDPPPPQLRPRLPRSAFMLSGSEAVLRWFETRIKLKAFSYRSSCATSLRTPDCAVLVDNFRISLCIKSNNQVPKILFFPPLRPGIVNSINRWLIVIDINHRWISIFPYWVTDRNFNISAPVISSIVLAVVLIISLGVNLYQWRARGISKTDKKYSTKEFQVKAPQNEGGL